MVLTLDSIFSVLIRIVTLLLFVSPYLEFAFGLDEPFEVYTSTQSLGMGGAITADTAGYVALYHNPAGLATFGKKKWELNLVDLQGFLGISTMGKAVSDQTLGMYRFFGILKNAPGTYASMDFKLVPSFTIRNFGISFIGSHRFSGESNGTVLDMHAQQDLGVVMGYAHHLAGNLLKLGISGKFLIRNEMKGEFSHDALAQDDDSTFKRHFNEGYGIGADIGAILTLPNKWLPTIGLVWQDVFDTRFTSSNILNSQSTGRPDKILQKVNAAFSLHPILGRGIRSTFAIEYKDILRSEIPFRKHTHVGIQIETDKELYFWAGLSHFYPSAAIGYRVRGGNLELGTYGEDIGEGTESRLDQRIFFRYSIGF